MDPGRGCDSVRLPARSAASAACCAACDSQRRRWPASVHQLCACLRTHMPVLRCGAGRWRPLEVQLPKLPCTCPLRFPGCHAVHSHLQSCSCDVCGGLCESQQRSSLCQHLPAMWRSQLPQLPGRCPLWLSGCYAVRSCLQVSSTNNLLGSKRTVFSRKIRTIPRRGALQCGEGKVWELCEFVLAVIKPP